MGIDGKNFQTYLKRKKKTISKNKFMLFYSKKISENVTHRESNFLDCDCRQMENHFSKAGKLPNLKLILESYGSASGKL